MTETTGEKPVVDVDQMRILLEGAGFELTLTEEEETDPLVFGVRGTTTCAVVRRGRFVLADRLEHLPGLLAAPAAAQQAQAEPRFTLEEIERHMTGLYTEFLNSSSGWTSIQLHAIETALFALRKRLQESRKGGAET